MNILLLNRSFWPDIEATGEFLTELCLGLKESHSITVIAGRSYFIKEKRFRGINFYRREKLDDIDILRVRHTVFWKGNLAGRLINWLTYSVYSSLLLLFVKKPDVIIVCTDPPFLGIIVMVIGRLRGVPFIYNCQDIYPDVALVLGKLREGMLSKTFDFFNKKALYSARFVVPIGKSMKDRLVAKKVPEGKIKIIPYWIDISKIKPLPKNENPFLKELKLENKFIIMYTGNIGLSQDFIPILNALEKVKEEVCLFFLGHGVKKDFLKDKARLMGLENVFFIPHQPREKLPIFLSMADLHLIPLIKGMSGAIVPSKMYTIIAAGKPYLAITDPDSEPAVLAKEYNCGLWAAPADEAAITDRIVWAVRHPKELQEMGSNCRKLAETKFDKNIIIKEWFNLLEEINNEKAI